MQAYIAVVQLRAMSWRQPLCLNGDIWPRMPSRPRLLTELVPSLARQHHALWYDIVLDLIIRPRASDAQIMRYSELKLSESSDVNKTQISKPRPRPKTRDRICISYPFRQSNIHDIISFWRLRARTLTESLPLKLRDESPLASFRGLSSRRLLYCSP